MVSPSGELEAEHSGLEGKRKQINRGSGDDPPVRSNFPSQTCAGPRISEGASNRPRRPDRVRKEDFNEETRAKSGIPFYFRWCSTHCIVFEALPREQRTLRVCGHQY